MELPNISSNITKLFPTNDIDAFQKNQHNNWIYNKYTISSLQNIPCNITPIPPSFYPIILKPIYNLSGMSKDVYKITCKEQYDIYNSHQGFWSPCFEGTHRSIDCVIVNNELVWNCCFIGHKLEGVIGAFDHWELNWDDIPNNLLERIKTIISKLGNYTGILNVEAIGDNIIECHLRPGDILYLDDNIITQLINLYKDGEWDLRDYEQQQLFLVPIWYQYIKDHNKDIKEILGKYKNLYYDYDYDELPGPPFLKRQCLMICEDLNLLFKIRSEIYS
jgi:hypothetical protein